MKFEGTIMQRSPFSMGIKTVMFYNEKRDESLPTIIVPESQTEKRIRF